jgi:hypothetical protein
MILLLYACCCLLPDSRLADKSQPPRLAEILRELHQYEHTHGRDAWSWQELQTARRQVRDPLFSRPPLPAWAQAAYLEYLRGYPLVLLTVILAGGWLARRCWRKRIMGWSIGAAILWFAVLFMLYWSIRGDSPSLATLQVPQILRQGNGLSYPPVTANGIPIRLAEGVEARVRTERSNGWSQIELPEGTLGWVPSSALLRMESSQK